jgi:hypothetical protein
MTRVSCGGGLLINTNVIQSPIGIRTITATDLAVFKLSFHLKSRFSRKIAIEMNDITHTETPRYIFHSAQKINTSESVKP